MAKHVAFLRAINTGNRRVKNPQLTEVLIQCGATSAVGFLASGNVIFEIDRDVDRSFVSTVEGAFNEALRFNVPAIMRTEAQVREILANDALGAASEKGQKVFVALTRDKLTAETRAAVLKLQTSDDDLAVCDTEVYWLPRSGQYNSELDVSALEKLTGVMTIRTLRTLERIRDKFL